MSFIVELAIERAFRVGARPEAVFAVLADVPASASHYPDLERLEDLGDNCYRWTLEALGTAGLSHAVVYACRYVSEARAGRVSWAPLKGEGNAEVRGRWKLDRDGPGTRIRFATTATLRIPAPLLLRPVIAPFVELTFRGQIRRYHDNLRATFDQKRGQTEIVRNKLT